jgi:hypothetical protein
MCLCSMISCFQLSQARSARHFSSLTMGTRWK